MDRRLILLLLSLAAGCATPRGPQAMVPPRVPLPPDGFVTQRAIFNARGSQFPLNGYLAVSQAGGKRLVLTESFGHVVADVLVKPDGAVFVMQSSRMFPAKYIRLGVAKDLECIFGGITDKNCPVQTIDTNHFIVDRHGYRLDLRILSIQPGRQPADLFDESKAPGR